MILTILGIVFLALAGFLGFVFLWGHVFVNWLGKSLWQTTKESFPRILIVPALALVGLLLILL